MSETPPNPDVRCTLPDEEAKQRLRFIRSTLANRYAGAEELADGYVLTFHGCEKTLTAVSRFVANERRCCSFAEYTVAVSPPYDETELTITGPEGTKAQFDTLIDLLASPPTDDGDPPAAEGRRGDGTDHRTVVRDRYAEVARPTGDESPESCCDGTAGSDRDRSHRSRLMGYSEDDLDRVGPGANLGLGCGNPTGIASLTAGDTVVDLGSGGGFDCFLAAQEVGEDGHVIGVDMTPEMVETARKNVEENAVSNVEFRLGEIEHLPVADTAVDVVISNCVVNLSPDKSRVFEEAFRVLRPGGRVAIADIVVTADLPEEVRTGPESVAACIADGATIGELESVLRDAGFANIGIEPTEKSETLVREWDAGRDLSEYIAAVTIEARKPETAGEPTNGPE